jgi:HD-like signal output (HDOD) protein
MSEARLLLKKFHATKTLSPVAIRLTQLISNEKSTIQEFEKVIKMDPTLVMRLLKLVNSPFFGLRQEVDSISRAVVVVGTKNLRNMVVTAALKNVFAQTSPENVFSRARLWLHCAAVSICSQMISERIFGQKGEDAFLCSILHDIGMIVQDQVTRDRFVHTCSTYDPEAGPFIEHERAAMGTDHCEIGGLLAEEWNLPVDVVDGIRYHHDMEKETVPSSILGIIQVAHYLVSKLDYTAIPGMKAVLPGGLTPYLRENINEYKLLAGDLPDELENARDLYETDG